MTKPGKPRKARDPSTYNTQGLKRGGSPGRRKGSKNKITIERELRAELELARRNGDVLGIDRLRYIAHEAAIAMAKYRLFNDDGSDRKRGNMTMWFRFARLMLEAAVALLPFESPRLTGLVISPAPGPQRRQNETINMTCNIFDKPLKKSESVPIDPESDPVS